MQYDVESLETITTPQVFNPPKRLLTWSYSMGTPVDIAERDVLAILPAVGNSMCKVLSYIPTAGYYYNTCCAEIPQQRATNRELSEWCAKGKGQVHYVGAANVHSFYSYQHEDDESYVTNDVKVRKWGDKDWHEPTKDYLGIV